MTLPDPAPSSVDTESEFARLAELAQDLIARCLKRGADQVEVDLSTDRGLNVNVRLGEVETLEFTRNRGLALSVYRGQRKGSASTADLTPEAIEQTLEQALAIARYTEPDPAAGLAEPERLAREFPDLDTWHPWALSAEAAIELGRRIEQAGLDLDPRIRNSEGASVASAEGARLYATSHGFLGRERGTRHTLSCALLADADEAMERDYWYSTARASADLEGPEAIGRRAGERALRRLGARRLSTRTVPVVYTAELARGLIGHLIAAASGGALYRRASFLLDRVGQRIAPPWFQAYERPHLRRGLGSCSFDDDGVATCDQDLIRDGVLTRYVLGTYSARKLGLASTGNAGGVHNLIVAPNAGDLNELLRAMGRGLLVTELLGQGVNLVTGDYSRGAAGFWVEGGEIVHPVHEITIAGNLAQMLAGIVAVGSDQDLRGNVRIGSLWIDRMTVAGGTTP